MTINTKVKEITEASASVGLLLATALQFTLSAQLMKPNYIYKLKVSVRFFLAFDTS